MALIRQADARNQARDAIVLDLGDLMHQGDQIKAAAKARAAQIITEAEAERKRILAGAAQEARSQGLLQGHQEGLAKGTAAGHEAALVEFRQRFETLEKSWGAALGEFVSHRTRMLREAQSDIITLAALMAEKVTRRAVNLDKPVAVEQLAAILSMLARPTRLRVSVCPDDEPILKAALPSLVERFGAVEHIELIAVPGLARGSCIARTDAGGRFDASVDTQIERLVAAILPDRPGPTPEPGDRS